MYGIILALLGSFVYTTRKLSGKIFLATERIAVADYLKIPEVARRLDVSEKTARRYVKAGTIPSVFVGGAYRVSEAGLLKYLQGARIEPEVEEAPKSQAPGPWRVRLRALDKEKKRDLALAAKGVVGDTWLGATTTRELRALKAFAADHGVSAEEILETLIEDTPGLDEMLDRLEARARIRAEEFAEESREAVDATLERAGIERGA